MEDVFISYFGQDIKWLIAAIAVILGFIEKSGIKWNPYSSVLKAIGRGINGEMLKKIEVVELELNKVKNSVDELRFENQETAIVNCRTQFTRFADELRHNVRHSKDHFDQTLLNITKYEQYCLEHPKFANNVTEASAELIKKNYKKRLENNDFLE